MSTANLLSLARLRAAAPRAAVLVNDGFARPRAFPFVSERPHLPVTMRDELLELYAFIFCQHGFHQLGMTFEQFLLVVVTIKPDDIDAMFTRSAA
jgi:hypothetical protein